MKPCIVWQTDFSLKWGAVASMRGVVKQVDPTLECHDITHEIEHFNIFAASCNLLYVEPFWPKGTIFVSVVDPGVGTSRRASVAKLKDGNYVVTPDNGTLTHLYQKVGIEAIREIDETVNRYKGTEEVSVFHGRDLFAYCAAKLASGLISFEEVGPEYPVDEIILQDAYNPVISSGKAEGFLASVVKHFGNCFTNIPIDQFKAAGFQAGDLVHTEITYKGEIKFSGDILYHKSFGFVEKGEPIVFNGSPLVVCIALNQDSFADKYGLSSGEEWKVVFSK